MDADAYVPFSERPGFEDLEPILQNDGPNPPVNIAYPPAFVDAMNYFRAICATDERSERALLLTSTVIGFNAANYTAWHVRRLCLAATRTKEQLREELHFVEKMVLESPKNYQIWFHRRWLVGQLGDYSEERRIIEQLLQLDAKNYHAWAHRQWLCATFASWEGEIEFTSSMIASDVRNNSAWNHRWFVLTRGGGTKIDASRGRIADTDIAALLDREVDFTLATIKRVALNESSWSFLRGLLRGRPLASYPAVIEAASAVRAASEPATNVFANELLAEAALEQASLHASPVPGTDAAAKVGGDACSPPEALRAAALFEENALYDSVRGGFWRWRAAQCKRGAC